MKRLIALIIFGITLLYSYGQTGASCSTPVIASSNSCYVEDNTGIVGTISPSCIGAGSNNNMWFSFIADSIGIDISVNSASPYTLGNNTVSLFANSGGCSGTFTELDCDNSNSTLSTINYTGLTVGYTYYVLVDGRGSNEGTFELCLSSFAIPAPSNNDVCNAQVLTVGASCSMVSYTTVGATHSYDVPVQCTNYEGNDVWFEMVVPASGNLVIDLNAGSLSSLNTELYSTNSCTDTFALIDCRLDQIPYYSLTGLTPGETLFLRVSEFGNADNCLGAGLAEIDILVDTDGFGQEVYMELVSSGTLCGDGALYVGGNTVDLDCDSGGLPWTTNGSTNGYPDNSLIEEGPFCVTAGSDFDLITVDDYGDGGTIYYIYVDNVLIQTIVETGAGGTYTFNASGPPPPLAPSGTFSICAYDPLAGETCQQVVNVLPTSCGSYDNTGITGTINPSCLGAGSNNSMWFAFVADQAGMNIVTDGAAPYTIANNTVAVYSSSTGGCDGTFTQVDCDNPNATTVNMTLTGLNIGETYYVLVDGRGSNEGTFELCLSSFVPPPPPNDDPCGAVNLTVNTTCTSTAGTTTNATSTSGIPAPGCANYLGGDVWFTATVPADGNINISTSSGGINNVGMAVYSSASCSGPFTLIECDDIDGPGLMPFIQLIGRTPGEVLYIRVWENGNNANGTFNICTYNVIPGESCQIAVPIPTPLVSPSSCATYDNTGITGTISPSCLGPGSNNSMWLSFVADSSAIQLQSVGTTLGNHTVAIFENSGGCSGTFSELDCSSGNPVTMDVNGLTVGDTYYVIVDGVNSTEGVFGLCADSYTPADEPDCLGAVSVLEDNCGIYDNTGISTSFEPSCFSTGNNNNMWFSFVASTNHIYAYADGDAGSSPIGNVTMTLLESFDGSCGPPFTELDCSDYSSSQGAVHSENLTPGETYYVLVDGTGSSVGTFELCLSTCVIGGNDACFNAIPVTDDGTCYCGSLIGATDGLSGSYECQGGGSSPDVNYSFVATGTELALNFTNDSHQGDLEFILFGSTDGTCGGRYIVGSACGPSPLTDTIIGLGIGKTYYYSISSPSSTPGTFNSCLSSYTPPAPPCVTNDIAGDSCVTATPICNLNGYCGNTSTYYSTDLSGNVETKFTCGYIHNNSWLSFVADSTDIGLYVYVDNCQGNAFDGSIEGIQMLIFETANCQTFTSVSNCWSPGVMTNGTIDASGLTVGQTYYLMIDGFNKDVCDYTISVQYGIATNVYAGIDKTICQGDSVALTATGGNGIYTWQPMGIVADTIYVKPSVATQYWVESPSTNPDCPNDADTVMVNVNTGSTTAGFSYPSSSFCPVSSTVATLDVGATAGVFSSSAGLSINSSTGEINLAFSTPGTYRIYNTVASSGGCSGALDSVDIVINPLPIVVANTTSTSICDGDPVTLTGSGASTYTWDNGVVDGVSFTPVSTLTYTVTGTDVNNCTNTDAITVTVNPAEDASFSYSSATFCLTGTDPTPTITGTPGGTFTGSAGLVIDGTSGQIDLASSGLGSYVVTYTTPGTCSASSTFNVDITNAPDATFSYAATPYCPTGTATVTFGGGASGGVFTSTAGLTINSGTGEVDLALSTPGTYTVTNTIAASGGCSAATATSSIEVLAAPTVVANATTTTLCDGDPVTLTGSGAITYTWDNGVVDGIPFNPSSTLTYTLTGTDGSGCTNTNAITVTVNPLPTVVANATATTLCDGDPVTLTGSGASTYTWDNGVVDGTPFNPSSTLTYTVTGTDGSSCTNTDAITVTVNPLPTVVANATTTTLCDGDPVTLTGSGASTYTWDNGVVDGTPFNPSSTLTYTVTGTDGSSCTNTDAITVAVNPLPTVVANTTATTLCNGDPVTLTGSGATTYSWDNGVVDGTPFNPTSTLTYTVTGTDGSSCTNTNAITVTVNPLPTVVANATATTLCDGDPVTLTGSGASTYTWDNGVVDGASFNPSSTLTYTVTGMDGSSCTNTDAITVTVNPLPTVVANATATTLCDGDPVTLTGSGASTYTWDNGAVDGTAFNPSSTLTYTVTGTDGSSCTNTDAITVSVNPLPTVVANATATTLCDGDPVTLTGSGASTYTWDNGVVDGTPFNPSSTLTYTVTGTDGSSCTNTDAVTVTVIPADDATFSYSSGTFCLTGSDPTPTITGTLGGTFSGSAGLVINPGTGEIDLVSSGLGSYVVTYTTPGICVETSTFNVDITNAPNATFSYAASPYCPSGTAVVNFGGGASGGVFSSTAGLIINSGTGEVDLALSTPGIYTVTNSIAASGGCSAATATTSIEVLVAPTVVANATATALCDGDPVTLTGSGASTYTWDNGVVDGTPFNPSSTLTYTVTGTDGSSCTNTDIVTITVNPLEDATFSYGATAYCLSATDPTPTIVTSGGTFSGPVGLMLNSSTGTLDLTNSSPGSYTVTYVTSGTCNASSTTNVTITGLYFMSSSGDSICPGMSTTLSIASYGESPSSYAWYEGTSLIGSGPTVTVSPATTTTYNVEVFGTSCGSPATDTYTVTPYNPPVSFTPLPDTLACNTPIILEANVSSTPCIYVVVHTNTNTDNMILHLEDGINFWSVDTLPANILSTTRFFNVSPGDPHIIQLINQSAGSPMDYEIKDCYTHTVLASGIWNPTVPDTIDVVLANSISGSSTWSSSCGSTPFVGSFLLSDNMDWGLEIYDPDMVSGPFPVNCDITYNWSTTAGCFGSQTQSVVIASPYDASFNYLSSTFCLSSSNPIPASIATTGGAFSGSAGLVIDAVTGEIDISSSGIGAYTVYYNTGGNCSSTDSASINITNSPDATFSYAGTPYCPTGTAVVSFGVGASGGVFSSSAGLSINASTGEVDLSLSTPGVYTVINNISASGGCSAATATSTIEILSPPSVIANASSTGVCDGDQVTLAGSGASTYAWDNGVVDGTPFTPSSTLTYTVIGTDANNCTNTDAISVTVNPLPVVVANASATTICDGDPVTLTGSGATTYSWDNGVTDGVSFNPTSTINYTVTGTDLNSCANTDNITVTVNVCAPVCNIDYFEVNLGGCDPIDNLFDITGVVEFTDPPTTGQLIVQDCHGNQFVQNAPFVSPINYTIPDIDSDGSLSCTIEAYFTANPTCSSSLQTNYPDTCICIVNIGTSTISSASTTGNLLCYGDSYQITSNMDFNIHDYSSIVTNVTYDPGVWLLVYSCPPTVYPPGDINTDPCLLGIASTNNGNWNILNDVGLNDTYYYVPVTMYSMVDGVYSISINGAGWCYDLGDTYEVTYLNEISFTDSTGCTDGTVSLTMSGGIPDISATDVFVSSNLTPLSAQITPNAVGSNETFVVSNLQNGDTWSFDVVDSMGCTSTISGVYRIPDLLLSITADSVCSGDSVTLFATGATSIIWNSGVVSGQSYVPDSSGYEIAIGTTGTCSDIDSLYINVKEIVNYSIEDLAFCEDQPIVPILSDSVEGYYYMFGGSGGVELDSVTGLLSNFNGSAVYTITFVPVESCYSSVQFDVAVNPDDLDCGIVFYSGFTPNNDQINDVWTIKGVEGIGPAKVQIFNRWGDVIWYTDNYDNQSNVWTGLNMSNEEMPTGVYYFVFETDNYFHKGYIDLTR